jgi:2-oxo-3-hexenedioate decarboxylase
MAASHHTDSASVHARAMLQALRSGDQLTTPLVLELPDAYSVTAALRDLRQRDGETRVGRKIGFTNRTIWPEYNVFAPIWGDMYDATVRALPAEGAVPLAGLMEPRIEPEIAFKLACAPSPEMDEADLLDCMEWVCHAFEIVQSPYPGWKFTAAQGVAGAGLHGALLLGPAQPIEDPKRWLTCLRDFSVALYRNDERIDTGHALNVLDGPLSAVRHLIEMLATDAANAPLAAGEIVTTGTLTRAFPVAAGERWRTVIEGLPLAGIALTFS